MQSIGLSVEEIAFIYLALPFTTFIAPPITGKRNNKSFIIKALLSNFICNLNTYFPNSGFLVDKFGKFKPVIIVTFLLNALFHHALFLMPQQEIPGTMPASYVMRHPETGNVEVSGAMSFSGEQILE